MIPGKSSPAAARRVVVVEDEHDIASVVLDYLRNAGFDARHFDNGRTALDAMLADPPALVLLDVMLPGMDGLDVLRTLRRQAVPVPVILLTARVEEIDRLVGLESGADDYICKPFSPREVVARVLAVLRRSVPAPAASAPSPLQIDAARSWVQFGGRRMELTRKEFLLLQALASRPGWIFPRSQLLDLVYPDELDANERALDSHVKNLRRKLAIDASGHEWIRSVYGVGFCFETP